MRILQKFFVSLLFPSLALALMASSGKPKVSVRFHLERNANSGESFSMAAQLPGSERNVSLSRIPEISENDVAAVYPFPAVDGSYGCAFRLNAHGQLALDTLSSEARGATLVCFVNGRAVTAMLVDKRISDGVISIAYGLQTEEVQVLCQRFRVLGQGQSSAAYRGTQRAPSGSKTAPRGGSSRNPGVPVSGGVLPRGD